MSMIISAEKREERGKNVARRIRREGNLPAILYGSESDSVPLILNKKDIFNILKSETGENTIFQVSFQEQKQNVMIKDYQQDVVTDEIQHVDLIRIAMDKAIRVDVPVNLIGEAVGVKTEGGFVDFVTREIEVECLPKDIPENIDVDITELHLNQSFKVEDLEAIQGVKITSESQLAIVMIQTSAAEEAVVEEEEELMAEEGQPEVIKKEKTEEESRE
jgi:large subunit ribosomal protein L25